MKTIEYTLHFRLAKYKDAQGFNTVIKASDKDDIESLKEKYCKYFEKMYNTPVKCIKVDKKVN